MRNSCGNDSGLAGTGTGQDEQWLGRRADCGCLLAIKSEIGFATWHGGQLLDGLVGLGIASVGSLAQPISNRQ